MNFLALFLLVIGFSISGYAGSEVLSLDQFISLLKAKDPEYRKLVLEEEKVKHIVDEGMPTQAFQLEVENEYGFGTDGENTKTLMGGISKEILESGTELSVQHTKSKTPGRDENLTELRLQQPLLNNFLGRDYRLHKSNLEKKTDIAKLESIENFESYLNERIKLYLDFSQAASDLKLAEQLYRESQRLYQFIYGKHKKSIANQTDLKRARVQMILREEDILRKQAVLEEFKKSIILASGLDLQDVEPQIDLLVSEKYPLSIDQFEFSRYRRYLIVSQSTQLRDGESVISDRASYPDLNLILGYDFDRSTRFTSTVHRNESVIGFTLNFPIWDTKTSAQASIARLNFMKSKAEEEALVRDLERTYLNLKQKIEKLQKRVQLSKEKVQLMSDILKEDHRRYRVGKLDLAKIIEINNDYAQYQFQYSQDRIEFNRVYVDWLSFNDALLVSKN